MPALAAAANGCLGLAPIPLRCRIPGSAQLCWPARMLYLA